MTATLELTLQRDLPHAARGDRQAYGRIVGACQNTVTAIALAITRDVHASQDIAQDAFLKAWQQLGRLHNPASFMPWLRQITRNLARDWLRAQRGRPLFGAAAELAIGMAADPGPTPAEQALQLEEEAAAADIIAALPEDSRETLLLYYREGQSSQQVAQLLGLSDAAVRKRLSRARAMVREELMRRFADFARGSAPSAAFAAVVCSALALASPPAAAAGLMGLGAATGAKTGAKLLAGSLGVIGVGAVAAVGGIWLGLRRNLRGAIDALERRQLIRSSAITAGASLAFIAGMMVVNRHSQGWLPPALLSLAFFATVLWQAMVREPRIKARRHALEAARDPALAAHRRRRERVVAWLGCGIGIACGFGALVYGLISSGRLG